MTSPIFEVGQLVMYGVQFSVMVMWAWIFLRLPVSSIEKLEVLVQWPSNPNMEEFWLWTWQVSQNVLAPMEQMNNTLSVWKMHTRWLFLYLY